MKNVLLILLTMFIYQPIDGHKIEITNIDQNHQKLSSKVSLSISGYALDKVLKDISIQTGVLLECDKDYSNRKVQIYAKSQPLSDIMAGIADLFQGNWSINSGNPSNPRYIFTINQDAINMQMNWWHNTNQLIGIADDLRKKYQQDNLTKNLNNIINDNPNYPGTEGTADFNNLTKQAAKIILLLPDEYRENIIGQMDFRESGRYVPAVPDTWIAAKNLPVEAQNEIEPLINSYNMSVGAELGKVKLDNHNDDAMNLVKIGFTNINGLIKMHLRGFQKTVQVPVVRVESPDLSWLRTYYHDALVSMLNTHDGQALERSYGKATVNLIKKLAKIHQTTFWPTVKSSDLPSKNLVLTETEIASLRRSGRIESLLQLISLKTGTPMIADYYNRSKKSIDFLKPTMDLEYVADKISKLYEVISKVRK